jgi:hypothetical protein
MMHLQHCSAFSVMLGDEDPWPPQTQASSADPGKVIVKTWFSISALKSFCPQASKTAAAELTLIP